MPNRPEKGNGALARLRRALRREDLDTREGIDERLCDASKPGLSFFLLVFLSCVIATLGLVANSTAIVIGAMLVAPLMSPILGIGFAFAVSDASLLRTAARSLVGGASWQWRWRSACRG